MLHITFNSIKAKEDCYYDYDILSNYLGGDSNYGMDKPISLIKCLESNTLDDVIWALRATLEDSSSFSKQFAIACAEHVLPIFEEKYPEDKRPREALEAAKAGTISEEILKAADAAYYAAAAAAAAYYAYAAACSSRNSYYAAACSSRAAAAAACADAAAACATADAAAAAAAAASAYCTAATAAERQWQKELLIKMLSKH